MSPAAKTVRPALERTRVLLVEDHPLVAIARWVDQPEVGLTVCGEAEDRHQAIEAIKTTRPGLVIIDLTLKNSDGLELIKEVHSRWPRLLMLVVSMHDESLFAERVIRAGARGYITKQEAARHILLAIRRVLEGDIYLNDKIATHIISRLTAPGGSADATPDELRTGRCSLLPGDVGHTRQRPEVHRATRRVLPGQAQ